ncbi:YceI family protein [Psychrobacter sp. DAB_AL62B]|uniref:YceI family protein n=1 Tax=Psychrobacter sp. DAB_AL62B TaxID=1028420 RepID=UPI002380D9D2|nr:YceI family protein [Psychrobacter sp. DAB_AL62B]MDE4454880.1 polyisoprenoid-binding protein [Psychrobacter sp. DAB_AL62B]
MNIRVTSLLKITLSTCLLVSLPAMALAATIPQKWKLDVPKTNVDFEVKYLGKATTDGKFNKVNGAINYDVKNPTSTTINFTVYTDSIDTDRGFRDSFLRRKELLNTQKYPTMTFVSKKVSMINPKEANVTGDFTVLGQTKPLTVRVTLSDIENDPITSKPTLKFCATGLVDRYSYGVTAFPKMISNIIPLEISGKLIAAN